MSTIIRIILVDGRELIRHGLQHMLEPEKDMKVVGNYASAEKAFCEMPKLNPDIMLMGTQLPGMDWIVAIRSLKRYGVNSGGDIIILAESPSYRIKALEAGAAEFLLKDMTSEELIEVIKKVYSKGIRQKSVMVLLKR